MERLCGKCGSLVSGEVKFCPLCGEPMQSAVDLRKGDAMPPALSGSDARTADDGLPKSIEQQNSGYSAPQYSRNIVPSPQNGTMTTGQWVGTILLCTILGPISLILNIVWGFGSSTPEPKRSFCRAMLIVSIIMYALTISAGAVISSIIEEQFARYSNLIPWFNF